MTKRKQYTSEFKREAVRLMESSEKPPSDLARQLGVRAQSALQVERTVGQARSRGIARDRAALSAWR
jgi:transposase-like protein